MKVITESLSPMLSGNKMNQIGITETKNFLIALIQDLHGKRPMVIGAVVFTNAWPLVFALGAMKDAMDRRVI
uniref:Uncharacterized protein n=1 Tax=Candidatus Kentrum sp. TUN TaxID=2126343 RepID=A0A450ZQK2_9GAMM|nr:MAG: hypothetical protein BECKTUN1418D_GA0071000_104116 [Candidatus Kentron sp. TUN]